MKTSIARWLSPIVIACAAVFCLGAPAMAAPATVSVPAPVKVRMTDDGPVFTTEQGMTLYYAVEGGPLGKASCTRERIREVADFSGGTVPVPMADTRATCLDKWQPLQAAAEARGDGDWTVVARKDGIRQWAFQEHPLYTSKLDKRPGQVNGLVMISGFTLWKPATAPLDLPPGLKVVRRPQGLVLSLADERPLYVHRGPMKVCAGCELLKPLQAPAVFSPRGDWAVSDLAGQAQYTFRGTPVYFAPEGVSDDQIGASREWAVALYRPAQPIPRNFSTFVSVIGEVYQTRDGRALYQFSCIDIQTRSNCGDPGDPAAAMSAVCSTGPRCAKTWPLLLARPGDRPSGEWTIEEVSNPPFLDARGLLYPPEAPKVKAWHYRGRPIYTFAEDEPGMLLGNMTYVQGKFVAMQVPGNTESGR